MADTVRNDPQARFGFIAAAMLHETTDVHTKRFQLYVKMLGLKLNPMQHRIFNKPEISAVFVLPIAF